MKIFRIIMKIVLVLIIINIFVVAGYFVYQKNKSEKEEPKEALIVDEIDSFEYVLDNNKDDIYKKLFNDLKDVLIKEEVNYEEYAKSLSKLFVTDLFTLSNKVSSSNVGGLEFVYKNFQKDFLSIAKTTLYNSVKSNIYGERNQELPTVIDVLVEEVKKVPFKYKGVTHDDSYSVKVSIQYEKDLGYPSTCNLVLIKTDSKLEIAKLG